jgi:hypothetical protein
MTRAILPLKQKGRLRAPLTVDYGTPAYFRREIGT